MKCFQFIIIPCLILLAACSKDDDSNNASNSNGGGDQISDKNFVITYYYDKDKDETNDFQGYIFTFGADGKLVASKNGTTTNGTWSIDTSDDDHDHFIINLGTTNPLEELNDDWEVVEISDSTIKLKDESGSGGTEILNFAKQ